METAPNEVLRTDSEKEEQEESVPDEQDMALTSLSSDGTTFCEHSGSSLAQPSSSNRTGLSGDVASINTHREASASNRYSFSEIYWKLMGITTAQMGTVAMEVIEKCKTQESTGERASIGPLLVCIAALRKVFSGDYLLHGICTVDVCIEALQLLVCILQQVIIVGFTTTTNVKVDLVLHKRLITLCRLSCLIDEGD